MLSPLLESPWGQTKPNDVDGWGKIKWGITVAEAKAALGEQASGPTEVPGRNDILIERIVIRDFLIEDLHCKVSIQSKRNSEVISAVDILVGDMRDPPFSRESAFDSLKKLLIEKYGSPKNEDRKVEGRDVKSLVFWTFPSTAISLRRSEGRYGYGYVAVYYEAVDKKALDVL